MTRLVVADDDDQLLDMLVLLLEELGHEVLATGRTGAEAVDAALREDPDVVLMDLRMPEMSGIEAASALRSAAPRLPVVLLSAYDDAGLQEAAADAGVVGYLVKGCSARSLQGAIEQAEASRVADVRRMTCWPAATVPGSAVVPVERQACGSPGHGSGGPAEGDHEAAVVGDLLPAGIPLEVRDAHSGPG